MEFEGFKLIFDDSIHEFLAEGEFRLVSEPNQVLAVLTLDNLELAIRPMEGKEIILEVENLRFVCTNLLMLPLQRSIVLTVNSTAAVA